MPEPTPKRPALTTTEEQLRRVTVGELIPNNDTITLADYDPAWPVHFAREEARIRQALGDRALRIEHTGSTSVPGLIAKPIIDILLVVAISADEQSYLPPLEAAGYVLRIREPDWYEHRVFKGPDTAINLHVFTVGSVEIERVLLFRDWMRDHPAERDLYAQTKRQLAGQHWTYVQDYANAKSEVVETIIARAHTSTPHL